MSTQQDIYVAGLENRHRMLNKYNYVPWSSRLLCYAKSKPNRKFLANSILHGPYVRRMIVEPDDPDCTPFVPESTHEHTDDELTAAEAKQLEADDQAIQTILMGLPEDIYALVDNLVTCSANDERHNAGNQIGFNVGQITGNQNGYNAVQNVEHQVGQNAVQNLGIQNVENQNGLIVVPRITNQNGNGNVVSTCAEGNGNGNNANQIRCYNCRGVGHYARNCIAEEFDLMVVAAGCEKIEEVNSNCILMANLQQASTSGIHADKAPVYDSCHTPPRQKRKV
uniref:CCHC-type domain-containing protein n=1 Tax=Tanacetum cinerariifolium TaxID=118510 RepID=A0A6L2KKR6_TANCI|nr:hypothetical protein [Tanacetum cinerariifolium]